jgi:hypothetical protein
MISDLPKKMTTSDLIVKAATGALVAYMDNMDT